VGGAVATATRCPATGCGQDPAKVSLSGIDLGQAVVAVLAVLAISGEYGSGMIQVTLTAMPRRIIMLAAKAAILTGLVVAGTVAVLGSVLAGGIILPGHGFTPAHDYPLLSLADGPYLRAAAGSVLYLSLTGLLGLLYLFPVVAEAVSSPQWQRHLEQIAPMSAGLAIQATTDLRGLPISPWAGIGVLAAWTAGAMLVGGLLLELRDA
jgi:ABC-2 type transport system permease protein